ncbi:tetratricopeptide repeat protein [Candidatus Nitronereus thalassa]|uniref:Tetratricopeptide repeat protein n=1 Tax=Candidatus Nitronereus thalassa TaxID=3020898 RepID=A0ABU3K2Z7_9BACT|nr:tetratricopeptide repeat protein [Candidatus Nitronereus thalassa]MDT7040751.1 tetratricopeptide repeat protein [Candidatus Nitronereus thalassa]
MKRSGLEWKNFLLLILALTFVGCATNSHHHEEQTLRPPANAEPVAAQALLEGNKLFAEHQWTAAKRKFMAAIQAEPTLAEAHYNLALTLEEQGRLSESRVHYKKAADLAPGNKVIWNAPPFRQYGTVEPETQEAPAGPSGHSH